MQCWFVRMFSCFFPKKPNLQGPSEIEMSTTDSNKDKIINLNNNQNNTDSEEIRPAETN